MKIIVGSTAARWWTGKFERNKTPDIDVWVSQGDSWEGESADLSYMKPEIMDAFEGESKKTGYATFNDLLTIKLSHLPWDIFWKKHSRDYLVLKMVYHAKLNKPLYELLKAHWKEVHGNKTFLSLYRTKDSFFDDFVSKKHDHDYLHELVAYPNKPVYTNCLKDGQEVAIDREKFGTMPFELQVKMFREEINVIACERWILNEACPDKNFAKAYHKSLHKTVTALTKGWASEFICENLEWFVKPNPTEVGYLFKTLMEKSDEFS